MAGEFFCMSIHTCYVDEMRAGRKRIELRKYDPHIEPDDWVVIYETMPTGSIGAAFRAGDTLIGDPAGFWRMHQEVLGIEEGPYLEYFRNRSTAYGLEIEEFVEFDPKGLADLRAEFGFTAPQGVIRAKPGIADWVRDWVEEI
jgi:predicted transcriptional regulator